LVALNAQSLGRFASVMAQDNQISKEGILEPVEVEIQLVEVGGKMPDGGGDFFINSSSKMKVTDFVDFKSEGTTASGTF
jgi:hypothetical protein